MAVPPYDESRVLQTCDKFAALFEEAGVPYNPRLSVWPVRVQHDYATGALSYPASEAKHLAECRAALGLETPLPPAGTLRPGPVRLDGRAFVDDAGPWCALGASYFPLVWMVRHDRDRAEANLRWLASRGVDYVRVFADVGGPTWADRTVDAGSGDWAVDVMGAIDLAASCGLRIAWTVFAGPFLAHPTAWYLRSANSLAVLLAAAATPAQSIELRNEGEGCDDLTMRACAQTFRSVCPGLPVALCGTPEAGLPTLYAYSGATFATIHYDRTRTERGWRPVRQPWGYYELAGMPAAHVNNEPIGVDSSVASEADPVTLCAAALTSWVTGEAGYVLHHGAGIRAGGAEDIARGRAANVWEQPTLDRALALITTARAILPADLPNWARHGHAWETHPLTFETAVGDDVEAGRAHGCNRAYAATRSDGRAVVLVAGIRGQFVADAKDGGPWTVWIPRGQAWDQPTPPAPNVAIHEATAPMALLTRGI